MTCALIGNNELQSAFQKLIYTNKRHENFFNSSGNQRNIIKQ